MYKEKNQHSSKKAKTTSFFQKKWFLVCSSCLVLLVSAALVKEFIRSHKINSEILALEQQIRAIEDENKQMQLFVDYLKTDRYMEEQARLKFGKQYPGEKMIVLKDADKVSETDAKSLRDNKSLSSDTLQISNPGRWWNYFFHKS